MGLIIMPLQGEGVSFIFMNRAMPLVELSLAFSQIFLIKPCLYYNSAILFIQLRSLKG